MTSTEMQREPDDDPIQKLTKDLKEASRTLSRGEVRFLVDGYYSMQANRIRAANQVRALTESEEPHEVLNWLMNQNQSLEDQIKAALGFYAKSKAVGQWALGITGIGPVISAGLLAHIEIEKAPTVGHIWRFAGLDPTIDWLGNEKATKLVHGVMGEEKLVTAEHVAILSRLVNRNPANIYNLLRAAKADEEIGDAAEERFTKREIVAILAKRPWNAGLKVICWKAGESFVKSCNNKNSFYGPVYAQRKQLEIERNEAGLFSDQAKAALERKKYGKDTDAFKAYEQGKLPPAHIHRRATRYAVKLFLAHLHEKMFVDRYGVMPPKPYVIEHLGHADYIAPPE